MGVRLPESLRRRLNGTTYASDIMRGQFHQNTDDFQISEPQMMFNARRMMATKRGFDVRAMYGAGRQSTRSASLASTLFSLAAYTLRLYHLSLSFLIFFFF